MAPPASRPPRWPYAIALAGLILDQWTKHFFLSEYEMGETRTVIPGFFNFHLTTNTGAAFSLFRDHPQWLTLFSIVVFGLMVVFRDHLFTRRGIEQTAFGLIAGGVIGNLMDRMRHGHVIDFIHWHVGEYDWPVFNIADSCICIGVGLYMLSAVRPQAEPTPTPDPESP